MELPEEWVEVAARAICCGGAGCDNEPSGEPCAALDRDVGTPWRKARAALTAVLPLILERAAGVADCAFHQACCGQAHYECCGNALMMPDDPATIATAIRALGEPKR